MLKVRKMSLLMCESDEMSGEEQVFFDGKLSYWTGVPFVITDCLHFHLDMACLNRLKSDIRILCEIFPRTHPLFRVSNATVDEISCYFVVKKGQKEKKYSINANITETYPKDPPVWFSDSDDIADSVQVLSTTIGDDNYVSWTRIYWIGLFSYCQIPASDSRTGRHFGGTPVHPFQYRAARARADQTAWSMAESVHEAVDRPQPETSQDGQCFVCEQRQSLDASGERREPHIIFLVKFFVDQLHFLLKLLRLIERQSQYLRLEDESIAKYFLDHKHDHW